MNSKEMKELKETVINLKNDIEKFIKNDFSHLSKKVDSLVLKIALILTGYSILNIVALILIAKLG